MIADFSIHNKGNGNLNLPAEGVASGVRNQKLDSAGHHAANSHAHIMLTMRDVTHEGFGNKNTVWNKKPVLMSWRKNWADINNRMFERKGLAERIDHRSYKDQGIDRKPMIHMGHKATALEKMGIRTDKGDYNREVMRRNAEREGPKGTGHKESQTDSAASDKKPSVLQKERDALTAAKRGIRKQKKPSKHLHKMKKNYAAFDKELYVLKVQLDKERWEIPQLIFRAEAIDEQAKNIMVLQGRATQLRAERQRLPFWSRKRKGELCRLIGQVEGDVRVAQHYLRKNYHITSDQAPTEIERVRGEYFVKKDAIIAKIARISEITEKQASIRLEYRAQKALEEIRSDRWQISGLLERMNRSGQYDAEKSSSSVQRS